MKRLKYFFFWLRSKVHHPHKQLSIKGRYFIHYLLTKYINKTSNDYIQDYEDLITKYIENHHLIITHEMAARELFIDLMYDCVPYEQQEICNKINNPILKEMLQKEIQFGISYRYGGQNENNH
jgi:hypothetical protein